LWNRLKKNSGENEEDEEEHSEKLYEITEEDIKCFFWRGEMVFVS